MGKNQKYNENKDWDKLYQYVKKEILEYDNSMKLPKFMVLRLRGLANGNFMANKYHKPNANYTYNEILLTFKACKMDIHRYTKTNRFKDEQHKFNYIMVIIENNINDIVLRLKEAERHKKKVQSLDVKHIKRDSGAAYKKKTKEIKNDRLKDLW